MILKNDKRGLALAEALVAVAIMTIAVLVVSSIVSNATVATKVSKDYLVGQNLATEAIEAVKNVRDTNWLLNPSRKECWLVASPVRDVDCAVSQPSVQAGANAANYIPVFESTWTLENSLQPVSLDLNANRNNLPAMEVYRLYLSNDEYLHAVENGAPSKFYRSINFLSNNGDKAQFLVTVEWLDGAKVRSIKRNFTIYNYL